MSRVDKWLLWVFNPYNGRYGHPISLAEIHPFRTCIGHCSHPDLKYSGLFSRSTLEHAGESQNSKIDRDLAKDDPEGIFLSCSPLLLLILNAVADFQIHQLLVPKGWFS